MAKSPEAPRTGVFVTLEGCEGAGKTTQAARLATHLSQSGRTVVSTREPAGEVGDLIRSLIQAEDRRHWNAKLSVLLFLAARLHHWRTTIRPALERGAWVVCDRFHDSTLAYQGAGEGMPQEDLALLSSIALKGEGIQPDLTLILDLDPEESFRRASARELDTRPQSRLFGEAPQERERKARKRLDLFEAQGRAFHQRVQSAFLQIAKAEPRRCAVVDASRSPEDMESQIQGIVRERLESSPEGKAS